MEINKASIGGKDVSSEEHTLEVDSTEVLAVQAWCLAAGAEDEARGSCRVSHCRPFGLVDAWQAGRADWAP